MRQSDIFTFASMLKLDTRDAGDNILVTCPFAEKTHTKGHDNTPSMSLKINPHGSSPFHCFSCKRQGADITLMVYQLQDLGFQLEFRKIHDFIEASEKNLERWDVDFESATSAKQMVYLHVPPPDDIRVIEQEAFDKRFRFDKRLIPYLKKNRGLNEETATLFDLRMDRKHDRIVIPVRWSTGEIVGAIGRLMRKPEVPYEKQHHNYYRFPKSQILFGENMLNENPIVVCEGPFDMMKVHQAGFNSVSVMGAKFSNEQAMKLVQAEVPVVVFFDNDDPGIEQSERLVRVLKSHRVEVQSIAPPFDFDAGSMSVEMLQEYLTPLVNDSLANVEVPRYMI